MVSSQCLDDDEEVPPQLRALEPESRREKHLAKIEGSRGFLRSSDDK